MALSAQWCPVHAPQWTARQLLPACFPAKHMMHPVRSTGLHAHQSSTQLAESWLKRRPATSDSRTTSRCSATGCSLKETVMTDASSKQQYRALWAAPQDDPALAKAVVIFLHGFSQPPDAYNELLTELAGQGILVVAPTPEPLLSTSFKLVQAPMVISADFFRRAIQQNGFEISTGGKQQKVNLAERCRKSMGLLGHSMGAAVSTYVAYMAATDEQCAHPYKAIMYLAPATLLVVDEYRSYLALRLWAVDGTASQACRLPTAVACQYGTCDILAWESLAQSLIEQWDDILDIEIEPEPYLWGTHMGFADDTNFPAFLSLSLSSLRSLMIEAPMFFAVAAAVPAYGLTIYANDQLRGQLTSQFFSYEEKLPPWLSVWLLVLTPVLLLLLVLIYLLAFCPPGQRQKYRQNAVEFFSMLTK